MTADAAGPVEAVLTEALAPHVYEAYRVGKFGTEDYLPMWHEKPAAEHAVPWPEVHAAAAALAPLFAEHGAAERRAGAVGVERWQQKWKRRGLVIERLRDRLQEVEAESAEHLRLIDGETVLALIKRDTARAAALGDRADEAVEHG